MAIEFMLRYECDIKKEVGGDEGLLALLKDAGRARAMVEAMCRNPEIEVSDETVMQIATGPLQGDIGSMGKREVTFGDLRRRAEQVDGYARKCKECPANVIGQAGGCSGAIHYPVSARAEEWLMDLLPDEKDNNPVRFPLFKDFIKDFGRNGRDVDNARKQGLYELRKPLVDVWGKGLFGKTVCTSSMILGNLYHVGDIQPIHGMMMAWFLGAVDRIPIGDNPEKPKWLWDMDKLTNDPDPSIQCIAWFLRALYQAYLLDVTVMTEP